MKQFFCLGTYTEPILFGTGEVFQGKGKGVSICSFEDGKIETLTTLPVRNPSFVAIDEEQRKIYAVNEMKEYGGAFGGGLTQNAGTSGVAEKNLNRWTVIIALLWVAIIIALGLMTKFNLI